MSANNRIFLAGLPCSVLVVATLWASDPAARSSAVILAVVFLLLGWLALLVLFGASSQLSPAHLPSAWHDGRFVEHGSEACVRIAAEFAAQQGKIRNGVGRAQGLFSEAVAHLIGCFQDISRHTLGQRQPGMAVIAGDGDAGSGDKSKRFSGKILETLQQFVENLLENTRLAMRPAAKADRIGAPMHDARSSLGDSERIAEQTGLLVSSAAMEAAEAGRGVATALGATVNTAVLSLPFRYLAPPLPGHVGQQAQKPVILKNGVDNNPVSQTGYAPGDVELF